MTTPLIQWAERHAIPPAALTDLLYTMGLSAPPEPAAVQGVRSEAAVQQQVRLLASQRGWRLWRNNSGVAQDETGRPIRYGLCNDSAQMNRVCKSSDLIGITPVQCQCGRGPFGIFTAYEAKRSDWVFRPSDNRAVAQLNFINLVLSKGGIGRFVTDPSTI